MSATKHEGTTMGWEKLPAIEGGPGGCLHCGYKHPILPMDAVIAVGFGSASLTKGDECIYDEQDVGHTYKDYLTVEQAEEMAARDPDHDWRIHLFAPLSERHYQRQGEKHWVLYEKGEGFA